MRGKEKKAALYFNRQNKQRREAKRLTLALAWSVVPHCFAQLPMLT